MASYIRCGYYIQDLHTQDQSVIHGMPFWNIWQRSMIGCTIDQNDTLDAFILSPVAVTGYVWRTVLEGGGPNDIMSKLESKFIGTLLASLKFWPGVNIINFAFVPVEYRVLYNNMLSLFWSGYLSYINNIGRK